MPKLRTSAGGAFESRGRFFARVTVAPQTRQAVLLPWCTSLDAAEVRARAVQELVNRLRAAGQADFVAKIVESAATADDAKMAALGRAVDGIVGGVLQKKAPAPGGPVTFRTFAERWTSGELHRQFPDHIASKKTSDDDEGRLEKWIYPHLEDVPLADVTLDHAQEVLRRLPRDLSPSSRRHVAQLMVRILNLAVYPCRLLSVSPLPRGFLPKPGQTKAKGYVYPDEDAALLGCAPEGDTPGIPLVHRLLYAFAHREGMRESEATSLTWADLNLVRGTVRCDENKTDDARTWTLGRDVTAALRVWRRISPSKADDAPVFPVVDVGHLAEDYREHLKAAGVDRPELFEATRARQKITFHSTRVAFITIALATGKSEAWVADRTGHKSSQMIFRYRQAARSAAELGVEWFGPMHELVPELAAAFTAADAAAGPLAAPRNRPSKLLKVHGKGLEPPRLAAAEPKTGNDVAAGREERDSSGESSDEATADALLDTPLPRPAAAFVDAVEAALADAIGKLTALAAEGKGPPNAWAIVGQLVGELEARRQARAGVVDLAEERRKRGGG